MTCHFVYAVPNLRSNLLKKVFNKLSQKGFNVPLVLNRRPSELDMQKWPIRSPYENTKRIYLSLASKIPTNLYHITEKVKPNVKEGDIFLGHPYFPYSANNEGITEYAIRNVIRFKKKALISPLHCGSLYTENHINIDYLTAMDELINKTDLVFGIMGEYWWDKWDSSKFSHWKKKMVRLDMAVDVQKYPRIKSGFNPIGTRSYLYIGDNVPQKGLGFLSKLASILKDYHFGWIGDGPEIPGIKHESFRRELTPEFMRDIVLKYDFFISPSIQDANPTTILEAMAWGLPVICTPQSGYYENTYIKNIHLENIERSTSILITYQNQNQNELLKMANEARNSVEKKYNWEEFTNRILKAMGL